MELKNIKDYQFKETGENIEATAFVFDIRNEGNANTKLPIIFLCGLEETGEPFQIVTWNYSLLDILKESVKNKNLFSLSGLASNFRGSNQIKLTTFDLQKEESKKKVLSEKIDKEKIKKEIIEISNTYIKDKNLKLIIKNLILDNDNFFIWPAASKMHHAFPSGLAMHSLNVGKHALFYSSFYSEGKVINKEVLIAGSLLHDIGKLEEYTLEGNRTSIGDTEGHITLGYEKIGKEALKLNCENDPKIKILKHIILSHHEKKEFGSPVSPLAPEAYLVALADAADAKIEAITEKFDFLVIGESTPVPGLNYEKLLKWE